MESFNSADQQLDGELSIDENKSPNKSSRGKWIWLSLVIVAVAAAVALAIIKPGASHKTGDQAGTDIKASNDHSPGSEVFLYIEGRKSIMVAVDEQSLDELIGALADKGDKVQALVDSGKVFTVPINTRVRVEESKFAKLKVRFIEGKRVMTEAWVPERWVR
jgi:hypothetical protein